ncbi:MAG: hypothetical protein ACPGVB_04905 [Chitinophagales bacterium]
MKKVLMLVALWLLWSGTIAQNQTATVIYHYERNSFNENQALPAETFFNLNGSIDTQTELVTFCIHRVGKIPKNKALFSTQWTRPSGNSLEVFSLPVKYKLRGGHNYDFEIVYYSAISQEERNYVKTKVFEALDSYIGSINIVEKRNIVLLKSPKQIVNDLNAIAAEGMSIYKNDTGLEFDGFSDIVLDKLKQIDNAKLKKGKFLFLGGKKKEARNQYAEQLLDELRQIVHNESEQYLNVRLLKPYNTRTVLDYPVEKTRKELAIDVGYGGVYLDPDFSDKDTQFSPFVGVSFPLARAAFAPFLANTSLSVGILLDKFKDKEGTTMRGLLVKRPVYAALNHRLFQFIWLNAGVAVIDKDNSEHFRDLQVKDLKLQPFVGVSAKINLSMRFR